MDDGEAATGAIAIHRNWAIATDDRQYRSVFKREAPHIQLISTPELVKHWVDNAHPKADIVSQVLKDIETRANYWVRVKDPLFDWWQMSQRNVWQFFNALYNVTVAHWWQDISLFNTL